MKKKIVSVSLVMFIIIVAVGVYFYHSRKQEKPVYLSDIEDISTITIDTQDFNDNESVIGLLTIDSIGLVKAPVAEGTTMDILDKYIGHFEETPYLNGNIALCGHNRGYTMNYFENLKNVMVGDLIQYDTKNKSETYRITQIDKILETDVEVLENNGTNQITLITCVENKPQYRYCVIGEKI